jgi:integrase
MTHAIVPKVDQLDQRINEVLRGRLRPNTLRAYKAALKSYANFCKATAQDPAQPLTLLRYLQYMADRPERPAKYATLSLHAAAIRQAFPETNAEIVRKWLGAYAKQSTSEPTRKAALNGRFLHLIRWDSGVKGLRDRALILVGFFGALRRSELVGLNIKDVEFTPKGMYLKIRRAKTAKGGEVQKIGILYAQNPDICPVRALKEYLAVRRQKGGEALFTRMRHNTLTTDRLSAQSVALIVKDYADRLGLDPKEFSGHSLRAGCITTAAELGAPEWQIQRHSRHKSLRVLHTYIRPAQIFEHNITEVLGKCL